MRSLERDIGVQRRNIEKPPRDPVNLLWRAMELLCGHSRSRTHNKKYRTDIGFWYRFERVCFDMMYLDPRTLLKKDLTNVEYLKSMEDMIHRTGFPSKIPIEKIKDPNDTRDDIIEAFVELFINVIREERRFAEESEMQWKEYYEKIEVFDQEHKEELTWEEYYKLVGEFNGKHKDELI